MGKNLAWLGVVLFAVSWFVEVHQKQGRASRVGGMFRELQEGLEDGFKELGATPTKGPSFGSPDLPLYGGPPGWQAARFSWDLLIDKHKSSGEGASAGKGDGLKRTLLGATCLTSVVMLFAVLALFVSLRGVPRLLGLLLLGCAALNLGWIYHNDSDFREGLRAGYYLWTGSFVLVGLAALTGTRDR